MHFPGAEFAVSPDDGGLLAGRHVPSSLRERRLDPAPRRSANLSQVQPVRLGCASRQSRGRRFPADTRGSQHLERRRSHALQLLVNFLAHPLTTRSLSPRTSHLHSSFVSTPSCPREIPRSSNYTTLNATRLVKESCCTRRPPVVLFICPFSPKKRRRQFISFLFKMK